MLEVGCVQGVHDGQFLFSELERPCAGICPLRIQELERSFGTTGYCHSIACSIVSPTLQLEVEPHAELLCYIIIYYFRTLDDASALDVVTVLVGDAESHTAIVPMEQVLRAVARHANQSVGGVLGLVLAVPIESVAMLEDAAAMSVDVNAFIVGPQLSAPNSRRIRIILQGRWIRSVCVPELSGCCRHHTCCNEKCRSQHSCAML